MRSIKLDAKMYGNVCFWISRQNIVGWVLLVWAKVSYVYIYLYIYIFFFIFILLPLYLEDFVFQDPTWSIIPGLVSD